LKLASTLKSSGVKTGGVNCEKERDLCEKHGAGYLVESGGRGNKGPIYRLVYGVESELYAGDKYSAKGIYDFVNEQAPTMGTVYNIENLRLSAQVESFISTACKNRNKSAYEIGLVYLTAQFDTSLLLKSIAFLSRGKAAVGEVYICI
jgi:hypothetical protein